MDLGLVIVAIAPIVFLAWFVYTRDRYDPEPRRLILKTFLVGAILVVPVAFIEMIGGFLLPPSDDPFRLVLHFLVVVALAEESAKYAAVRFSAYHKPEFNEPMDGLVYGAMAGLGFAAPENLLYVLSRGLATGIVRAVLSVPGHVLWGAIIGYYLARQKFEVRRSSALQGLSYAVILHTAFDLSLVAVDPVLGVIIAILDIAIGWLVFFKFTKSALLVSPYRNGLAMSPRPIKSFKYCFNCGSPLMSEDLYCRSCGIIQPFRELVDSG